MVVVGRYKTKYIGPKNNVEEAMGEETALGNGHVFVALGSSTQGPKFQNAIASLSRLGCTNLYHASMTDKDRANQLQQWILDLRLNADQVAQLFNQNGITTCALNSMTSLREANTSTSSSFSLNGSNRGLTHHFHTIPNHPIGGSVEMFSPCSLLSTNVTINVMQPQPKYGEHSKLILNSLLGFSNEEIDRFIRKGDVGVQWSNHYIPDGGTDLNPWNNVKNEYQIMMDRVKLLRLGDSKL